jgi:hypothetical protein
MRRSRRMRAGQLRCNCPDRYSPPTNARRQVLRCVSAAVRMIL